MNSRNLIVKIALGVSVVALLFSAVTLIRSIVIGASVAFPIIQVVGSAAIFGICCWMFRMLRDSGDEETSAEDPQEPDADVHESSLEQSTQEVDNLYEKYHLSDFEE